MFFYSNEDCVVYYVLLCCCFLFLFFGQITWQDHVFDSNLTTKFCRNLVRKRFNIRFNPISESISSPINQWKQINDLAYIVGQVHATAKVQVYQLQPDLESVRVKQRFVHLGSWWCAERGGRRAFCRGRVATGDVKLTNVTRVKYVVKTNQVN